MNRISTWKPRTDLVEPTENETLKKSLIECREKERLNTRELSEFRTENEDLRGLLRECRAREETQIPRPPAYNPEIPVVFAEHVESAESKKKKKRNSKKRKKPKPTKKKRKLKKYTKKPKQKKN